MNIRTLTLSALSCLFFQADPLLALTPEQKLASDYETFFLKKVEEMNITGAAFVVATPDGIVRVDTAGHTDTSRKQRIDENTTFRVASVSKTFAAGLTGVLVNEGEFDWEDPVTDYVPELEDASAFADATVGQVLDMTNSMEFDEDYADPRSGIRQYGAAIGWTARVEGIEYADKFSDRW